MKKILFIALTVAMVACPANVFAAPQDVNANQNYGDNGNPAGEGALFSVAGTTLSVGDGNNFGATGLNSIWTTAGIGTGTVNFAGNSTLTGQAGQLLAPLARINVNGAAGTTVRIGGAAYIQASHITNTGTLDFDGLITGTHVTFDADGTVILSPGINITLDARNTNSGEGTLVLQGIHTFTGDIGSTGVGLKLLTVGNGDASILGSIKAATINYTGDNKLSIADAENVTGTVTTSANNQGELKFNGTSTMSGDIGVAGTALRQITLGSNDGSGDGKQVDFAGNVFATNFVFNDDGIATIADGKNLTATVSATDNGEGTLTLLGTNTVTGNIGTNANRLKALNINGAAGKTAQINGDVFAATTSLNNTGTLDLNGSLTGTTLNFGNDGVVTLADGKNITATIANTNTNQGTLTLEGAHTITGDIGSTGAGLKLMTVGNGAVVTTGDIKATTINFAGDNALTIGAGKNVTANITTSTNGTGTLTLSGAHTITGDVGVAGTALKLLTVGNGAVVTTGNLVANAINFAGDNSLAVAAGKNITGDVTNTNTNEGTLTLQGAHTINGDIGSTGAGLKLVTVGNGAVAANGDIKATTINFAGDNTLSLADGKNITGAITTSVNNTGTLTYLGASTTQANIAAAGTALKAVNINGGVVALAHDIFATTTTVNAGGTLQLTSGRTITGNTALAGTGILDVGANTLNITGTYNQAAGTTLRIAVLDDVTAGSVVSGGNATVNAGSSVDVTVSGYVSDGTAYKVVDGAGGAGVALPTITDNSAVLSFTATTDGADLTITANRSSSYEDLATTDNTKAVGAALESAGMDPSSSNDMKYVLDQLDNMSAGELESALEQLMPDPSRAVADQSFTTLNTFLSTVFMRLGNLRQGMAAGPTGMSTGDFLHGIGIWGQGFGNHSNQDERGGIVGYKASVYGGAMGLDKLITDAVRVGAAFSYARTNVESKVWYGTDTDINTYQSTLYATYDKGNFYVDGLVALAYGQYYGKRDIVFTGVNRTAKSDYDGIQFSSRIETGYTIEIKQLNRMQVTPKMSLQYSHLYLDDYLETGADALNLKVRHQNFDAILMGIGGSFAYPVDTKIGTFIPEIHMMWYYDFMGDKQQSTSTFNGGGSSFATNGIRPAQSSFNLGAQLSLITKKSFRLSGNYDMEVKENFWGHSYYLTARVDF